MAIAAVARDSVDSLCQACHVANDARGRERGSLLAAYTSLRPLNDTERAAACRAYVVEQVSRPVEAWASPLSPTDHKAIAEVLGVKLEADWRCDEVFLAIFSKDEIAALASEWKLVIAPAVAAGPKGKLIEAIVVAAAGKAKPPKSLLKAKPCR